MRKRPQRVTPWFNDARRRLVFRAKLCIWRRCLSSREQGEAWQEQDALNHHPKDGGSDERNSRVSSQGFLTGISRHSIPTSMAASHLGYRSEFTPRPCAQAADPSTFPAPGNGAAATFSSRPSLIPLRYGQRDGARDRSPARASPRETRRSRCRDWHRACRPACVSATREEILDAAAVGEAHALGMTCRNRFERGLPDRESRLSMSGSSTRLPIGAVS